MDDTDCTELSQILTAGVSRLIKLCGDAPVHPGYNRQPIILLLNDGTFQHWKACYLLFPHKSEGICIISEHCIQGSINLAVKQNCIPLI